MRKDVPCVNVCLHGRAMRERVCVTTCALTCGCVNLSWSDVRAGEYAAIHMQLCANVICVSV